MNLAIAEIIAIKENASKQEIERLIEGIGDIEGTVPERCIYGTMVGSCYDERALDLIEMCTSKFVLDVDIDNEIIITESLDRYEYIGRNYSILELALFRFQDEVLEFVKEIFDIKDNSTAELAN